VYRKRWKLGLAAVGVLAVGVLAGGPAAAEGGWGDVDCRTDPSNAQCVIQVGSSDAPGSHANGSSACHDPSGAVVACFVTGAGWLGDDGCYYQPASGSDLAAAQALGGVPAPPAQWYVGVCGYPPVPGLTKFRIFAAPPGPALLAAEAVKALRLPSPMIVTNPSAAGQLLVGVPVWLWLNPVSWGARSATASVPGMSITATATPSRVLWSPGDATSLTCTGPGSAWSPGDDPRAGSPTCGHTYTTSSAGAPGAAFTLRATITWRVTWAGAGATGTVPDLQTTAQVAVTVAEAQAVTGPGAAGDGSGR
jgi:hypothetical protein